MKTAVQSGRKLLWVTAGLGSGVAAIVAANHLLPGSESKPEGTFQGLVDTVQNVSSALSVAAHEAFAVVSPALRWRDLDIRGAATRSLVDSVARGCESPEQRVALVRLGGDFMLDWLLRLGCNSGDQQDVDERGHAQRALAHLLQSDVTASTLLLRPGAVPQLLRCVGSGRASVELAAALEASAGRCRLPGDAFLMDLVATIKMLKGSQGEGVRHLAAAFLAAWAEGSASSRHKLTGLGLHQTLAQITYETTGTAAVPAGHRLQWALLRAMRVLLAQGSVGEAHHLACLVEPVLYVAADAAVAEDETLVLFAVDTLAVCAAQAAGDGPVRRALAISGGSPLLRRLVLQGASVRQQTHAVRALAALVRAQAVPPAQVPVWRDWLLECLVGNGSGGEEDVMAACVEALQALSATPGALGLQGSLYWLSRLLQRLADKVSPYRSVAYSRGDRGGARDLEELLDVAPVLPQYVRAVARELQRTCDAVAGASDDDDGSELLPQDCGDMRPPAAGARQRSTAAAAALRAHRTAAARAVDAVRAEKKVCEALDMLCAIVAVDSAKQQWLLSVGILPLVQQLVMGPSAGVVAAATAAAAATGSDGGAGPSVAAATASAAIAAAAGAAAAAPSRRGQRVSANASVEEAVFQEVYSDPDGFPHLLLRRQTARLLGMLALQPVAHAVITGGDGGSASSLWQTWLHRAARSSDCRLSSHATKALLNLESYSLQQAAACPSPYDTLTAGDTALRRQYVGPPVFQDMVHLLNPHDQHHWDLLYSSCGSASAVTTLCGSTTRTSKLVGRQVTEHISGGEADGGALAPDLPCTELRAQLLPPLPRSTVRTNQQFADLLGKTSHLKTCHYNSADSSAEPHLPLADLDTAAAALILPADWKTQQRQPERSSFAHSHLRSLYPGNAAAVAAAAGMDHEMSDKTTVCTAAMEFAGTEPLLDVVFVHGIRGGPFITWRTLNVLTGMPSAGTAAMAHSECWPSAWLADDVPRARLLTVEYLAPVSGWEGESLPLEDTVTRVCSQLLAAGVGMRPIVFVTHSMGGLLVKEILARGLAVIDAQKAVSSIPDHARAAVEPNRGSALTAAKHPFATTAPREQDAFSTAAANAERAASLRTSRGDTAGTGVSGYSSDDGLLREFGNAVAATSGSIEDMGSGYVALANATQGVVFYATPHFGSEMAAYGWRLRHVPGTAVAPSIERLAPGPHLFELNDDLKRLYNIKSLALLSFIEGKPTQLVGYVPKILIVPQVVLDVPE